MSYETESNKNGISKATNKLFFGSKIKKTKQSALHSNLVNM